MLAVDVAKRDTEPFDHTRSAFGFLAGVARLPGSMATEPKGARTNPRE